MNQEKKRKFLRIRLPAKFIAVSWRDLALTLGPVLVLSVVAVVAAVVLIHPAPPDTITITTGPEASIFHTTAEKYQKILARSGVKLNILLSEGALENLNRLTDPAFKVDVAFVQGGLATEMATDVNISNLVSLGTIMPEPLLIFYRSATPVDRLTQFRGKRLSIGAGGSGTRFLSKALLKANGIEPGGDTTLLDLEGQNAANALTQGKIDCAFLMGESASREVLRGLLTTPDVRLLSFAQAEGYTRKFHYLSKLVFPMGSFDLGKNIPDQDVSLVAPGVELVARQGLHPALSDLLIEAAREIHGSPGVLRGAGEYPAPLEREYRISDDASRYYKSGKGFLYGSLPFWLASLVNRFLVVLVPIVIVLVPGLRLVPTLYNWRLRSRIYRWYGELLALERDMLADTDQQKRAQLQQRIDDIQKGINHMKMPIYFADQIYVLRQHVDFVRGQLEKTAKI